MATPKNGDMIAFSRVEPGPRRPSRRYARGATVAGASDGAGRVRRGGRARCVTARGAHALARSCERLAGAGATLEPLRAMQRDGLEHRVGGVVAPAGLEAQHVAAVAAALQAVVGEWRPGTRRARAVRHRAD